MSDQAALAELQGLVRARDVRTLCRVLFGVTLTKRQAVSVRRVAFLEQRRLIISAHTRYGKTRAVALGICLLILLDDRPLKIRLVGPTALQADILRRYIAEHIIACPLLQELLDTGAEGADLLKKEVSKRR